MATPYIIVTNGPTGSGKSVLMKKVIKHYGLEKEYRTFLIDDLIESNEWYKQSIDLLIVEECKSRDLCPALKERLNHPDSEFYEKFSSLYYKYRGKTNEKWCNNKTTTCNDFLDHLLEESIRRRDNIVFETVGTYYAKWLIDKLHGYKVYFAFTILDFDENIRRNNMRAVTQMRKYIHDRTTNAPRLPDVSVDHLSKTIKQIGVNLLSLMTQKMFDTLPEVHHIIVFDNTTESNVVIYDSDTVSTMAHVVQAIEQVTYITCPSCKHMHKRKQMKARHHNHVNDR